MLRKKYIIILILLNLINGRENQQTMIKYNLKMPNPSNHYFQVEIEILNFHSDSILLKMPVWAPGSYLVREFSKNIIDFESKSDNKNINNKKINKNTWKVETKNQQI